MKKVILYILLIGILVSIGWYIYINRKDISGIGTLIAPSIVDTTDSNPTQSTQKVTIVAEDLDTPWSIAVLPDNSLLVTERKGDVRLVDQNGNLNNTPIATIENAKEQGEGGLLGIALHPNFSTNNYVYLYYTYDSSNGNTLNRVVRRTLSDNKLVNEKIIVDQIPGASNHNGGKVAFGPDGMLYIGTGDAQEPSQAQNKNSLAGKILRVTDEGSAAPGNPFGNRIYSYGHRNVQGLTWDNSGSLFATEHGRSAPTGFDELNKIEKGKNYGWPDIEGDQIKNGMVSPIINSGPTTTWAPASIAYINNSLYFAGLKGASLYKVDVKNGNLSNLQKFLTDEYGRLRDVVVTPDGMLYITTSNQDGRGRANAGDDKIIKINPTKL